MEGEKLQPNLVLSERADQVKAVQSLSRWGCCPRCILRFLGEKEQHTYRKSIKELAQWVKSVCAVKEDVAKEVNGSNNEPMDTDPITTPAATTSPAIISSAEETKPAAETSVASTPCEETTTPTAAVAITEATPTTGENDSQTAVCVACLGMLQGQFSSDTFLEKIKTVVDNGGHEYHNFFCSVSTPVSCCLREHALWLCLKEMFPKEFIGDVTDMDVVSVKEVWKWINGRALGSKINTRFSMKSDFTVSLNFAHSNSDKECAFLFNLFPNIFRQRKNNTKGWEVFTRMNVLKAIGDTKDERFRKNYSCPPRILTEAMVCDPISSSHEAVFLAGRYNKYSRDMSQTPWILETGRKTSDSVEEVICLNANQHINAKEYRFSSSGREDVDVRMLGKGRPFVVEFVDPKKETFTATEMAALQRQINNTNPAVKVRDLQLVTREDTQVLKTGETEKTKNYSALCYANRELTEEDLNKLNQMTEVVLYQKTPVRVLHRRNLATRERMVHSASASLVAGSKSHFILKCATQAGTYIKEFVHGDFGRTSPNVGEILDCDCDILELDVEDVMLDWPKPVNYDEEDKAAAS